MWIVVLSGDPPSACPLEDGCVCVLLMVILRSVHIIIGDGPANGNSRDAEEDRHGLTRVCLLSACSFMATRR